MDKEDETNLREEEETEPSIELNLQLETSEDVNEQIGVSGLQETSSQHEVTEACAIVEQNFTYKPPSFDVYPSLVYNEEFSGFTSGVKWSMSGDRLAVVTDRHLHLRSTVDCTDKESIPDEIFCQNTALIQEPQPIHDFAWLPNVDQSAVVTTCNTQPIHLYDGMTGKLLCSYRAFNHLDELISAYSVKFNRTGDKVCAGYKKEVRLFDVEFPRRWNQVLTWKEYQAGIVSAMDTNSDNLLAVGTYCKTVALYDLRTNSIVQGPEEGQQGGITQVRFSYDDTRLYVGGRKDNFIICRDTRNLSKILYQFPRKCDTNQRIQFDLPYEENYLCTGNTDGSCFIWDLKELDIYQENKCRPNLVFMPHSNLAMTKSSPTNGISFHPWSPVIATSSGGRPNSVWDDKNEQVVWEKPYENRLKIWKFRQH